MESSKISLKRAISSTSPSNQKIRKLEVDSYTCVEEHTQFQDDIRCSICSEILMKATTLNCSHSFCKYCIDRWTAKQSDCPICRSKIIHQVPTLVLDNIIENIVHSLPKALQKHREKLMAEREKKSMKSKNKSGWIKMRRMNGLSSYYMVPKYVNARRHLNEVTIMYFEDDPEWEDLGEENDLRCQNSATATDEIEVIDINT
ncbi:unnamed protein product [Psylliodes chrysocephalus]|uniref:RING-type domain-containing protein n=1 Tax=Psylliodes chrysocephalus TaxID=3402493 RepID=A0A9P0CRF5_9CUCU|nr:unnamed protein product [Psylliodes chrysocephala]